MAQLAVLYPSHTAVTVNEQVDGEPSLAPRPARRARRSLMVAEREELITKHLPLVRFVAGKIARRGLPSSIVEYDDLVGYGTEGLIRAVDSYDPDAGTQFSTWAVIKIRAAILDALRALDPVSRPQRVNAQLLQRVSQEDAHLTGEWPSEGRLVELTGLTQTQVRTATQMQHTHVVSLSDGPWSPGGEDAHVGVVERLADEDPGVNPDEMLDTKETFAVLRTVVGLLPEREAQILRLYYWQGVSMRDIADRLGVSESRISQLHSQALRRARLELAALTSGELLPAA